MNSGIEDLREALESIQGSFEDYADTGLLHSKEAALSIEKIFADNNSQLESGWDSVGDFLDKIQTAVTNLVDGVSEAVNVYVEESSSNVEQEKDSVEDFSWLGEI